MPSKYPQLTVFVTTIKYNHLNSSRLFLPIAVIKSLLIFFSFARLRSTFPSVFWAKGELLLLVLVYFGSSSFILDMCWCMV